MRESERPVSPVDPGKSERYIRPLESMSSPSVRMFQPHQLWMSTGGSSLHVIFVMVTSPNFFVSVTFATFATALVATTMRATPVTECRPRSVLRVPRARFDLSGSTAKL